MYQAIIMNSQLKTLKIYTTKTLRGAKSAATQAINAKRGKEAEIRLVHPTKPNYRPVVAVKMDCTSMRPWLEYSVEI